MTHARKWPLPPEITRHIVELACCKVRKPFPEQYYSGAGGVPRALDSIASHACVCNEFRREVERLTFNNLRLTYGRLADISRIMCPQRWLYVRKVTLDIELEPYRPEVYGSFETAEEVYRHSIRFSETVRLFFQVFHRCTCKTGGPSFLLQISPFSPSDISRQTEEQVAERRRNWGRHDIFADRYKHSILHLIQSVDDDSSSAFEELPTVLSVNELLARGPRHVSATAWASIINGLPNAKKIHVDFWDNQKKDLALRKRLRDDIGNALAKTSCPEANFTLSCNYQTPRDHEYIPPRLIDKPCADTDAFTRGLRVWTRQLKALHLTDVVISPGVFSPPSDDGSGNDGEDSEAEAGGWPHLEKLHVEYAAVTPHGTWMLERNPEDLPISRRQSPLVDLEEHDQESLRIEIPAEEDLRVEQFRSVPVVEEMDRLYRAAGRAALQMPVLREMHLVTHDGVRPGRPDQEHCFLYNWDAGKGVAKAHWGHCPLYQPAKDVVELWKEVARKVRGCDLEVVIDEEGA